MVGVTIPATVPFVLGAAPAAPAAPAPVVDPVVPFTDVERLKPDQLRFFHAGLCKSHERRIEVDVLHLNGDPAGTLGLEVTDGSVAGTKPGPDSVSRVLTLTVVDQDSVLDFSPSSPGETVYFDRMLRVHDDRCIPDLGWVRTTVFTGPVWTFSRAGNEVTITAHSKERLAMGTLWTPVTLHQGTNKFVAIRRLLEITGETEFGFRIPPDRGHQMPEKRSLDRFASAHSHAWKLARSENRMLYPDAHGVWQARRLPERTSFRFVSGDGGSVLADPAPEVTRDLSNYHNTWLVLGKKPKGSKERAKAVVQIPHDHPLSSSPGPGIGRNGQRRIVAEKIEDDSLRSDRECRQVGEQHMGDAIRGTVEASFAAAPIPDRELGELDELVLPGSAPVSFRLWEFNLPLAGGPMSVGQVKRIPRRHGHG